VLANAVIGLLTAGVLAALSTQVLRALFGPSFVTAAGMLQVLSVSIVVGAVGSVAGDSLNALGEARLNMSVVAAGAVITAMSTLLLVPQFGGIGAAAAHTLGVSAIAGLGWGAVKLGERRRLAASGVERPTDQ
jgi:O-antigen/teichoic acid export membrane protein